MDTKEGPTKIVTWPRGIGSRARVWPYSEMHYFFKNPLFSGAWFRQTKWIVIMKKEGSTKISNLMTPGAGVPMLEHGHIVNMQYFFSSSGLLWDMDQEN